MSNKYKIKFKVKIEKMWKGAWNFGICFVYQASDEAYILINLFKISICIGRLIDYDE